MKLRTNDAGLPVKNMQESTSNDTTPSTSYTVTLEGDEEECFLPLPDSLLDQLDWNDGDMLDWIINDDNTITIRKVTDEPTSMAGS